MKDIETDFDAPVSGEPWNRVIKRLPSSTRDEFFDHKSQVHVIEVRNDSGCFLDRDHGLETDSDVIERWAINDSDPLSATVDIDWNQSLKRENWVVSTKSKLSVSCSVDFFFIKFSSHLHLCLEGFDFFSSKKIG